MRSRVTLSPSGTIVPRNSFCNAAMRQLLGTGACMVWVGCREELRPSFCKILSRMMSTRRGLNLS